MARKTFISYKYSEAKDLRDKIIEALGNDASYYKGETAESPNLTGEKVDSIKNALKNMIYDTSVTLVVLSPNMKQSNWIDWEIAYSLKEYKRSDRASKTNGVVGIVQKVGGSYDWLVTSSKNDDGCDVRSINNSYLSKIVNENRFNRIEPNFACEHCKTYDQLNGSYISIIEEDSFLAEPSNYIENAYEKSKTNNYKLSKQV